MGKTKIEIPTAPRAVYTVAEFCAQLGGVSRAYVYSHIKNGDIRAVRLGRRTFVPHEELQRIARGEQRK